MSVISRVALATDSLSLCRCSSLRRPHVLRGHLLAVGSGLPRCVPDPRNGVRLGVLQHEEFDGDGGLRPLRPEEIIESSNKENNSPAISV